MPNPDMLKDLPALNGDTLADDIRRAESEARSREYALAKSVGVLPFECRTVGQLQEYCGSFRRMIEMYWNGTLPPQAEREIEDRIPKETLIGYRPVA